MEDPHSVNFQRATLDDVDTLLTLVSAYYELDGIAFDLDAVRRGIREIIANPLLASAWLIRDGETYVGHAIVAFSIDLEFGGRQATLTDLYLTPEHRRRGIGSKALAFVEHTLRALGIGALELQVERDNVEALAFYAKFGMLEHARIPLSKRVSSLD